MDSGLDKLREHILRTMPGISSGPHALLVFMLLSSVLILEGLKSSLSEIHHRYQNLCQCYMLKDLKTDPERTC